MISIINDNINTLLLILLFLWNRFPRTEYLEQKIIDNQPYITNFELKFL